MIPTQGKQYTVKSGDTLKSIASSAYGDPAKSTFLYMANNFNVIFYDQNSVAVGEIINIPRDPVLSQLRKRQLRR